MQPNLTLTDGAKGADPLCVSVVYFQFFFHLLINAFLKRFVTYLKLIIKKRKEIRAYMQTAPTPSGWAENLMRGSR